MPAYIVVQSNNLQVFEKEVCLKIREGYRIFGSLVLVSDSLDRKFYHQAMIW